MGEIGFKGFKKGLVCRDKQYAENTVFEEPEAEICVKGMHYCKNPFDVLDCYDLVNESGSFNEFATVEALAEEKTDDNKEYCTTKLKIGKKFSFSGFIKACVEFVIEKTKYEEFGDNQKDGVRIGSSDNSVQIGSSGNFVQIGNSGYRARIGSSGNSAQIGSSGNSARIGSSGNSARIGSSGNSAQIGSSGNSARIGSSGNSAQIGSSGNSAQIGSSGDGAQIGSSGDDARIGSSGDDVKIGSSGDDAKIGSSGDDARIDSAGEYSVIMCAGQNCKVKAKMGSFITLAEWEYSEEMKCSIPMNVKTEKVDGKNIKPDTYYQLENGEFLEA